MLFTLMLVIGVRAVAGGGSEAQMVQRSVLIIAFG